MTGAIAHRGPDDEQIHLEPGVALGARRLSIVDLAGGRQPISNEDGSIWVTQNGEIFEYPELQTELAARGHRLATRCDTELWAHLYEDLGEGFFEKARGQFAVALWDRNRRTVILGRDRVGICPLYYTQADGWLLWGSEIKALSSSGMIGARPDPKGIDLFFNTFCAGTTRTFFEGIKSIPPGHFLRVRDGRVELKKYWDLDFPDAGRRAPARRPGTAGRRAGIPDAAGGRAPAARRRAGGQLHQRRPRLDGHPGPELAAARVAPCRRSRSGWTRPGPTSGRTPGNRPHVLGSTLATVTMNRGDIVAAYPELIRAAEGPVMDSSAACLMRLARAVHEQGYKVVLTGEGADEALAGYAWFKTQKIRDAAERGPGSRDPRRARGAWLWRRSAAASPPARIAGDSRSTHRPARRLRLHGPGPVGPLLDGYLGPAGRPLRLRRPGRHQRPLRRWHPLNQSLYVGYKVMLAGLLLLAKGDRVAMNSSVEARYPLLDEDVIAFCASIAPEYKLRGLTDKWLLRQVAARTLPARIANRPKDDVSGQPVRGVPGPSSPGLGRPALAPRVAQGDGLVRSRGGCASAPPRSAYLRITPKRIIMDLSLTCVIATQLWHHLYLGGGLCELPTWESAIRHGQEPASPNRGIAHRQPSRPVPAPAR